MSIYCPKCVNMSAPVGYKDVPIFTQKCSICKGVSLVKIVKDENYVMPICSICEKVSVAGKGDICSNCKYISKLDNYMIMCYFCQMIPKTITKLNDGGSIICGICNRKFHSTIIKTDKIILAHPYENKGPTDCEICKG